MVFLLSYNSYSEDITTLVLLSKLYQKTRSFPICTRQHRFRRSIVCKYGILKCDSPRILIIGLVWFPGWKTSPWAFMHITFLIDILYPYLQKKPQWCGSSSKMHQCAYQHRALHVLGKTCIFFYFLYKKLAH